MAHDGESPKNLSQEIEGKCIAQLSDREQILQDALNITTYLFNSHSPEAQNYRDALGVLKISDTPENREAITKAGKAFTTALEQKFANVPDTHEQKFFKEQISQDGNLSNAEVSIALEKTAQYSGVANDLIQQAIKDYGLQVVIHACHGEGIDIEQFDAAATQDTQRLQSAQQLLSLETPEYKADAVTPL